MRDFLATVLRIGVEEGCARSLMNETTTERLFVAGVGASGKPSITPALETVSRFAEMPHDADGNLEWDAAEHVVGRDHHVRASFAAGEQRIEGGKGQPRAERELVFP